MTETTDIRYTCPHCRAVVFRKSTDGSKHKARVSIVVIHKSGDVEINCPRCKRGVLLPVTAVDQPLAKARYTVRKT